MTRHRYPFTLIALTVSCLACSSPNARAPQLTSNPATLSAPAPALPTAAPPQTTEVVSKQTSVVVEYAIVSSSWLAPFVRVDANELKTWTAQALKEGRLPEVRHILVKVDAATGSDRVARKHAEALIARLRKGEDFAAIAREESDDPGSGARGGSVGADTSRFVEPFRHVAATLRPGQLTRRPVHTRYGWHIIRKDRATPSASSAAYQRDIAPRVAETVAQEILKRRTSTSSMDAARAEATAALLAPGADKGTGAPIVRTFDPAKDNEAAEATCRATANELRLRLQAMLRDQTAAPVLTPPTGLPICGDDLDALRTFAAEAKPQESRIVEGDGHRQLILYAAPVPNEPVTLRP
ncbi:peptidyl-prolyl cis-trans isomerase [Pendulispora rubella]|uniref:Peptidyl-prolyl cis-trans isomerase n=1 Tax=Pendulispora rubella TaxID=2741070 RepID=A0ABZ2L8V0_9BACT